MGKVDKVDIRYVAKIIHDVKGAYFNACTDMIPTPWEEVSEDLKENLISNIEFHIDNFELSARDLHDKWAKGILKQNPEYDGERPAKAFSELTDFHKMEINIFHTIVQSTKEIAISYL